MVCQRPQDGSGRRRAVLRDSEARPTPLRGSRPTPHQPLRDGRRSSHFFSDEGFSPERRPSSRPSTLMSSSRSGQWIPRPSPMSRQRPRSSAEPCQSLGYHVKGTESARPSARDTVNASSVTTTSRADGIWVSVDMGWILAARDAGRNGLATRRRSPGPPTEHKIHYRTLCRGRNRETGTSHPPFFASCSPITAWPCLDWGLSGDPRSPSHTASRTARGTAPRSYPSVQDRSLFPSSPIIAEGNRLTLFPDQLVPA